MFENKTLNRLEKMLEDAISGDFIESSYQDTRLSRLESKWKQYLSTSCLVKDNLEKEKNNVKSLVSDISHQTKTPMTNIKMYAQLLEENLEAGNTENNKRLVEEILQQTQRLEFLIQSLTKLSRLETNLVEVKPVLQELEELVTGAVASLQAKAEKKQISINITSELNVQAFFDMKWTKEVLENILDNAVKYSPIGSTVEVFVKHYELYSAICVKDTGMGIAEEDIPKIFTRFYRSEQVQQEDGVGIGLHMAREIISKQNGYIKVKSKPEEGSEFQIYLQIFQNC